MQLANIIVRLAGSLANTVPKLAVTPAEILVLQHIHGSDAVTDIRPIPEEIVKADKELLKKSRTRHDAEFNRLAGKYDVGGGSFTARPGEERQSIMNTLFPGAIKRLPETLEEIGIGTGAIATAPAPEPVPSIPDTDEDDPELAAEGDTATGAADAEAPAPTAAE